MPQGGTNFNGGTTGSEPAVAPYLTNNAGNVILARCTVANLPTGAGYAIGCIIEATDSGATYRNIGTASAANFVQSTADLVKEVTTNGTTPVNVFGTTNGLTGTVKAVYLIASDGTAANITVATTDGTVAIIAKGSSIGVMLGAQSYNVTSITPTGTMTVVSSVASGNARVFITYSA